MNLITFTKTTGTFSQSTYWSFIDAQCVCGHSGKELSIMAPSANKHNQNNFNCPAKKKKKNQTEKSFYKKTKYTDLKMGQCAELSQWKPLFFCPVRMSQMMMACGSSLVSIRGLKVTTYLEGIARTTEASDGHDSHQSLTCVLCLNGKFRQHSDRRRELGHN